MPRAAAAVPPIIWTTPVTAALHPWEWRVFSSRTEACSDKAEIFAASFSEI
jgi:hypothetical protein